MQSFLCFLGERVAIFSCFAMFLGESRHKNNSFFADLRDCVALGMEVFCVHATFLDFGDNLRCMKQVASSLVRQGIF